MTPDEIREIVSQILDEQKSLEEIIEKATF